MNRQVEEPARFSVVLDDKHREILWHFQARHGRVTASCALRRLLNHAALENYQFTVSTTASHLIKPSRTTILLERQQLIRLDHLAATTGKSRSAVIRELLEVARNKVVKWGEGA